MTDYSQWIHPGWYLAICEDCRPVLPQPFRDQAERDAWAGAPEKTRASKEEPNAKVFHVNVDGRTVPCIMVDPAGDSVALTCDWGAK